MHESELNRRKKKIDALLHAANDMIEAGVAAAWRREIDDGPRAQVVTTGMVVAYGRAFVRSGDYILDRDEYRPADPAFSELHDRLIWWRDKVYAHTDKEGGRQASIMPGPNRAISWHRTDFPVAQIDDALALFDAQRKRFEAEAEELQLTVNAELALGE